MGPWRDRSLSHGERESAHEHATFTLVRIDNQPAGIKMNRLHHKRALLLGNKSQLVVMVMVTMIICIKTLL